MKDITTEQDVKYLVDTFYDKVNKDKQLSPIFNDFAKVDWKKHLPVMYSFWSSILLGNASYSGSPFLKHIPLPINQSHFNTWIQLFEETITQNFEGENASEAIKRAKSIGYIFSSKLNYLKENK